MAAQYCYVQCLAMLKSNGLYALLNYPNNFVFDVIVYDCSDGPCLLGLLHKFNFAPMVAVSSISQPTYTVHFAGGHNYYSYHPYLSTAFTNRMTFVQRIMNMYYFGVEYYAWNYQFLSRIDELSANVYGADCPPVSVLEQRAQITLINTHPALHYAQPLPPNIIPVGGLQIKEPKPLPTDIEQFISEGKNGTILFSLGSNIMSSNIGVERLSIILAAFQQLSQYHFLWKFEEPEFPLELPSNVMIRKWLPQNDILNHANLKAFITHGGTLSMFEATWHAVPTIGMPFYYDQHTNVNEAVQAGVSEHIHFLTITTAELKQKLFNVLTNSTYAQRMAIRSRRLRDHPDKPLDRAVWWIEYLLRIPDASHLRVPTVELGFIRANSLDLYAIIFLIILAALFLAIYLVWKLASYVFKRTINVHDKYC